jgi:hypothetical protein
MERPTAPVPPATATTTIVVSLLDLDRGFDFVNEDEMAVECGGYLGLD